MRQKQLMLEKTAEVRQVPEGQLTREHLDEVVDTVTAIIKSLPGNESPDASMAHTMEALPSGDRIHSDRSSFCRG